MIRLLHVRSGISGFCRIKPSGGVLLDQASGPTSFIKSHIA